MKKILFLLITLLLLTGCSREEKQNIENNEKDTFILEKIDTEKDYVYLEEFKNIKYNKNEEYKLQNIKINIKGDNVDTVNLELKNFVLNSYNNMLINNDVMEYGNIITYKYYVTDKYISIIQDYYFYIDGIKGEENSNVYVISLDNGMLLDNKSILELFGYDEDKLLEYIKEHIDSEDVNYTIMQIKNDGYSLYINDKDEMIVIFKETLDDESIKKELTVS